MDARIPAGFVYKRTPDPSNQDQMDFTRKRHALIVDSRRYAADHTSFYKHYNEGDLS